MRNDTPGATPPPSQSGADSNTPGALHSGTTGHGNALAEDHSKSGTITKPFFPIASHQPEFPLRIPGQLDLAG